MKLFYSPGACSLATHIVLEWIGKPYETHKVNIHGEKSPELLERNPAGAVPVIEDDGWVLTQNSAILNYLADVYPEANLGGGAPRARAEINRWLGFVNSDVHPAYKPLFGSTAYLGDETAVEKTKAQAKKTLRKQFEIADARLADRAWIAGERSFADPYLFVMLRWSKTQKIDLSGLDNLVHFVKRMQADPAVQKSVERRRARLKNIFVGRSGGPRRDRVSVVVQSPHRGRGNRSYAKRTRSNTAEGP